MSANLLYITESQIRIDALKAICAEENYTLTATTPKGIVGFADYDLVFCDAKSDLDFGSVPKTVPVVVVYDSADVSEMNSALASDGIDVLAFPFEAIETASRLRCLSRLHMLQEELAQANPEQNKPAVSPSVLIIGAAFATAPIEMALNGPFQTECADDDITGLLRAAQGQWSCGRSALPSLRRAHIRLPQSPGLPVHRRLHRCNLYWQQQIP